jgi:hypothetical protein
MREGRPYIRTALRYLCKKAFHQEDDSMSTDRFTGARGLHRDALVLLRPSRGGGLPRSGAALLGCHLGGTGLPALQATFASQRDRCGVLPVIRERVLDLAGRDVHDQLGELVGVAWALA